MQQFAQNRVGFQTKNANSRFFLDSDYFHNNAEQKWLNPSAFARVGCFQGDRMTVLVGEFMFVNNKNRLSIVARQLSDLRPDLTILFAARDYANFDARVSGVGHLGCIAL